jgi:hypothetical protein
LDGLDNFVQTANSLCDWIKRDRTLTQEQKAALERFVVPQSLDWQICNQIANSQKHGSSDPRSVTRRDKKLVPKVRVSQVRPGGAGFAVAPSMRVFGAGDEVMLEFDGNRESALGFVIRTYQHFHYIFEMAPIPISQRVLPSFTEILNF